MSEVSERLEYLRGEIRGECISYGELAELQGLAAHIDPGDVELLEAAGVPEFPEEDQEYRVAWFIDIEAASPREAAEKALAIHRKSDSIATVFAVTGQDGIEVTVDLDTGLEDDLRIIRKTNTN